MLQPVDMIVSINGRAVKEPTEVGFEKYDLSKAERVASGKMVGDIIRKSRKLLLSYSVLSGPELDNIMQAIDTFSMFFPVVYRHNGVEHTMMVYRGAIKYRRFRTDGVWYWKDVTFDLIEQ